jgi:xylulokinase
MSETEYVLSIDLGTSGCKAGLVDYTGHVHAWAFREIETILLPGGGTEQDPGEWWRALKEACREAVGAGNVPLQAIRAVCANTQGETTVPVDENGEPLCRAILWMDTRGGPHIEARVGGPAFGYGFLKAARYLRLTGGVPSLTGKDNAGHMLFLKNERPELYAKTYKFLNALDYINLRLTGRYVSTFDSILTAWVTDNRDPDRIRVSPKLCATLGIPPAMIPEPVPCTEILGAVDPVFAREIGISARTPVVAGAIDATAAAIGAGTVRDGDVHLYLGTSSWLGAHVPRKKTDVFSAIAAVPCAVPSRYLLIALQATAGGNLTFLRDHVFYPRDGLSDEACPPDFFARLDKLVEESPAGANGILFTPWIFGERAPVEDRNIRAGIHNLSLEHTRADLVRAVLEGIALNTRWVLGAVEKFLGGPRDSIAVVGGGGSSAVWCRILADVLDRPIRQVMNPIQANLRGSAYIAAAALGKIRFDDVPERVQTNELFRPNPRHRRTYDLHYREFRKLYRATRRIHRRLNAFHHRRP